MSTFVEGLREQLREIESSNIFSKVVQFTGPTVRQGRALLVRALLTLSKIDEWSLDVSFKVVNDKLK